MSERELIDALGCRIRDLERSRRTPFVRSPLVAGVIVLVAGLSAAVPRSEEMALESRLAALEDLIREGPNGASQVPLPFQVVDAAGKVVFSVGDRDVAGAVNIRSHPSTPVPFLSVISKNGNHIATIGAGEDGGGNVATTDSDGKLAAKLGASGVYVYNTLEEQVAGVTRGEGVGRVGIWSNKKLVTQLTADPAGNGRVMAYTSAGKLRAAMYGDVGMGVFDDTGVSVVSILNRDGRGLVGVSSSTSSKLVSEFTVDSFGGGLLRMKGSDGKVAIGLLGTKRTIALGNSQEKTVAEITVSSGGTGLFQVWGSGSAPLAVLGKSVESEGGILQISNGRVVTSSLTVSPAGNGYWQLNDAGGQPMVEAGVTQGGRGSVKAGPMVKCLPSSGIVTRVPDCLMGRTP